jgi:hypothetical protein
MDTAGMNSRTEIRTANDETEQNKKLEVFWFTSHLPFTEIFPLSSPIWAKFMLSSRPQKIKARPVLTTAGVERYVQGAQNG